MDNRHYFKIPFSFEKNQDQQKLYIVGIIDCSYSMYKNWNFIAQFWNSECIPKQNLRTIVFDNTTKLVESNILSINIYNHGGGNTNISQPFILFEKILSQIPLYFSITVIFISDGQDNKLNTLTNRLNQLKGNQQKRQINFICLGIESQFPTFIAMKLRQLYHYGNNSIPALYLIEYASQKAFFNKFETMKQYFQYTKIVQVEPAVCLYPWDESVQDQVYEGTWVVAKSKFLEIDSKIYNVAQYNMNLQEMADLFRGWIQSFHLIALNNQKEAKTNAQAAYKEMKILIDQKNEQLGIDICQNTLPDVINNDNFYKNALQNYVYRYGNQIQWYLKEVQALQKGISLSSEKQFEAAKKINIGTITGKYLQKILALQSITQEEFTQIKNEFTHQYNKIFIKKQGIYKIKKCFLKQENDLIIDECFNNQYYFDSSIFNQIEFIKASDFIQSQFDLFQSFPLKGIAFNLKRYQGTYEDPWQIEVKYFPLLEQTTQLINLSKLVQSQFNVELLVNNDHKQTINCLLPLFNQQQQLLQQIFRTRYIKLILSYLITFNPEFIFNEAYLALLSGIVLYLFRQKQNKWSKQLLQGIYYSIKIFYEDDKQFNNFRNLIIEKPKSIFKYNKLEQYDKIMNIEQSINPNYKQKFNIENQTIKQNDSEKNIINFEKIIIHLFYIKFEQILIQEDLAKTFQNVLLLYFRQILKKFKFSQIVVQNLEEQDIIKIKNKLKKPKNLDQYFSLSEFRQHFRQLFFKQLKKQNIRFKIQEKVFEAIDSKLQIRVLKNLYKYFTKSKLDDEQIAIMMYHVYIYKGKCLKNDMSKDLTQIYQFLRQSIMEDNVQSINQFSEIFKDVENTFIKKFQERHCLITPMSIRDIKQYCQEQQLEFKKIQFDNNSGLCRNACLSLDCPFFLHISDHLKLHLDSWQGHMPLGFHRFVKARLKLQSSEIYSKCQQKWKFFPENYQVTKQYVMDYISDLKDAYSKIN